MKEEKVIKSLKITSIAFGLILGILSIFLVLNESFALFTSSTGKVTYSLKTYKIPMLTTGESFQTILRNAGYNAKITEVIFEVNKDLSTIDTSIGSFDLSNKKNGVVMGYITEDETTQDMYILHIATDDDIIYANPISLRLFSGNYYGQSRVFLNLKEIKNMQILDTTNVINMESMFEGCKKLTSIDLSGFITDNVTNMKSMFYLCSGLTSLDVTHFNTSNVTDMMAMFHTCSSLTSIDVTHFDTSKVTRISEMFGGCKNLLSIDVSHFDTSEVYAFNGMFRDCLKLTVLDLSNFNTGKATEMFNMFLGCSGLTSLDLSNFNTSNVTSMNSMFYGCRGLTSLDLSSFNTSNAKSMISMFLGCSGLTSLDLSNFNTSNVTDMHDMFSDCSGLTSLDLSSFNTSKVNDKRNMFSGCSNLTEVRLDNAVLNSRSFSGIFNNVPTTVHIYLKDDQTNRDFMSNNFSSYTNITWV